MIVVANGFDLTTFRPDSVAREEQRKRWGVVEDELLLGMVARWHAQKDHVTLLAAAGELASRIAGRWRLVLVGEGMEHCNASLKKMVQSHGLDGRVILAGCASNVPAVMNAIDIHVLSSRAGEAFPNVVAEAMACGTPSVVTAVGDSAAIVSDTGWVVTAGAAGELARALEDATAAAGNRAAWATRCEMARERIKRLYDMERMQQGFEQAWHVALKRTAA
jgi:glycosyltransferase involved in cell wall biosynthesis